MLAMQRGSDEQSQDAVDATVPTGKVAKGKSVKKGAQKKDAAPSGGFQELQRLCELFRLIAAETPSDAPKPLSHDVIACIVERLDGKLQVRTEVSALAEKSTLVLVTQLLGRDSQVTRGENSGRLLRHDFSANEMQLTELAANKAAQTTTADMVLPKGSSAVAAFIQNAQGVVLQSTQIFLDRCPSE